MHETHQQYLHAVRQLASARFQMPRLHSAHCEDHWERVRQYGYYLASKTEGADSLVVELFGLLHDCCRANEHRDPEHGPLAAQFCQSINDEHLHLPEQSLKLLKLACRDHDCGYTVDNPTIGCCWDSDRLDLDRVGAAVDHTLLSTVVGKKLSLLRPLERQKLAKSLDEFRFKPRS